MQVVLRLIIWATYCRYHCTYVCPSNSVEALDDFRSYHEPLVFLEMPLSENFHNGNDGKVGRYQIGRISGLLHFPASQLEQYGLHICTSVSLMVTRHFLMDKRDLFL